MPRSPLRWNPNVRPDKVGRLLQLRRRTSLDAKHALGEALEAERRAALAVEAATARLEHEMALALGAGAGDLAVEAYVRWLPSGQRALANANLDRDRAMEGIVLARAALAVALSAERAIEIASEKALAAEAVIRGRREVATFDEIGRAATRSADRSDRASEP